MESQEQIDNANLLLTQHRLKLEWNQMVWSVNNLRCGTSAEIANEVLNPKLTTPSRMFRFVWVCVYPPLCPTVSSILASYNTEK